MITADRLYFLTWKQRQRDHFIQRPSNAQAHCQHCHVEVMRGVTSCSPCTQRKKRT